MDDRLSNRDMMREIGYGQSHADKIVSMLPEELLTRMRDVDPDHRRRLVAEYFSANKVGEDEVAE